MEMELFHLHFYIYAFTRRVNNGRRIIHSSDNFLSFCRHKKPKIFLRKEGDIYL